MIFVTVGTQKKNFNRLYDYIKDLKGEVVVQEGFNNWDLPSNFKVYKYISFSDMNRYLDEADILITHGGPYNIFKFLRNGKRVILVPRMKKYKEHINDHQVVFANYMKDRNLCSVVFSKKSFKKAINSKKTTHKYDGNTSSFIKRINQEIDKLLGD